MAEDQTENNKPPANKAVKPRRKSFSEKQRKLIKLAATNPDMTLSTLALRSGYRSETPRQQAWNAMQSEPVKQAIAETKAALSDVLAKRGLDDNRIATELERGLSESRPEGKHSEYLDRLIRMRGHVVDDRSNSDKNQPSVSLFLNFAQRLQSEGVVQVDGTIKPIQTQEAP